VAGWSLPAPFRLPESKHRTLLEQYAELFTAVEINSSFYRPHKLSTYERWADSVPADFRFAVKVPRLITHEQRLIDCGPALVEFINAVRGLGEKLGVMLVQLPPGLRLDVAAASEFFSLLRQETQPLWHEAALVIACEARNPSWFTPEADALFHQFELTRVSADPTPVGCEIPESVTASTVYLRLHGSPRMYYSEYSAAYLEDLRASIAAGLVPGKPRWCIFDNTAAGAAWPNALALRDGLCS
jgi:uncharacterized protein YecE (DUF72 family)